MHTHLWEHLNQLSPIPHEEWRKFAPHIKKRTIPKGGLFISVGGTSEPLGFVESGAFRVFYHLEGGHEFTRSFCLPHTLVCSYASALAGVPSNVSAQALEDSTVLQVRFSDLRSLFDTHPCWERLGRVFAERYYLVRERRTYDLVALDASARYRALKEEMPDVIDKIEQRHIASFLGITAVSLSRLKRKISAP